MKRKKERIVPHSEKLMLAGVGGSILYSLYLFFIERDVDMALFIGLWAPTLFCLVNYINIKFKQ